MLRCLYILTPFFPPGFTSARVIKLPPTSQISFTTTIFFLCCREGDRWEQEKEQRRKMKEDLVLGCLEISLIDSRIGHFVSLLQVSSMYVPVKSGALKSFHNQIVQYFNILNVKPICQFLNFRNFKTQKFSFIIIISNIKTIQNVNIIQLHETICCVLESPLLSIFVNINGWSMNIFRTFFLYFRTFMDGVHINF